MEPKYKWSAPSSCCHALLQLLLDKLEVKELKYSTPQCYVPDVQDVVNFECHLKFEEKKIHIMRVDLQLSSILFQFF